MSQQEDKIEEMARLQSQLMELPALTVQEREAFIKWLDNLEKNVINIFYCIGKLTAWDAAPDEIILVNLVGNNNRLDIPNGMYCIDLPCGFEDKYRDAVTLAVMHFGAPGPLIERHILPEIMSIALHKPTAHERMNARAAIMKLAADNAEDKDLLEWTSVLLS